MDMRLKTYPLDFDGKHFELTVNMNVLADIQELHDGDLFGALSSRRSMSAVLELLAACLNEHADAQGWPDRYTPKQVGRMLPVRQLRSLGDTLTKALVAALVGDAPDQEPLAESQEDNEKNFPTREPDETASTSPGA